MQQKAKRPFVAKRIWQNITKECAAVLTMLYKKNGAVSAVGSGFFSDWALHCYTEFTNSMHHGV